MGGWAVLETGPKFHKFGYQGSLHMPRLPPPPSLTRLSPGGTAATTVVPLMRSPSVSAGCRIDPGRLIIDDEQAIPATQWKCRLDRGSAARHRGRHLVVSQCRTPYHSSGAVWESRWTSWAVRPNEPSGFRGRKELLNRASALVTTCP